MNVASCWERIGRPRLLVVGDLMLDRYTWGVVDRVSPEAPVLVLKSDHDEVRPGGAANVAALLHGLEADVSLAGIVSDDGHGHTLQRLLAELGLNAEGVIAVAGRQTTCKQRLVGRSGTQTPHQLLRVDCETCAPLDDSTEARLRAHILAALPRCDAVLLSDYAKGVLTPGLT